MQRSLQLALKEWKTKKRRKPLLLKGARQVGKTYTLKRFGEQCFSRYHYVNFENNLHIHDLFKENLDPNRLLKELSFALRHDIDVMNDLLIFDEIQACPNALTSLKYFNEQCPQLALAAAGSLLGVYMSIGSFPVGKVDVLHLYPLTFIEFIEALDNKLLLNLLVEHNWQTILPDMAHRQLWDLWKHYLVIGGMPEVVLTYIEQQDKPVQAMHAVRVKQNELIQAYQADIAKHSGKINGMHIARVWEHAAIQLSRTQDHMAARFHFKDVIPGIDRYQRLATAIDWLCAANLVLKVPVTKQVDSPLKAYSKESLFKLFYSDIGLLGASCVLTARDILQDSYGGFKGFVAENFVAQALYSSDIHELMTLYSWQNNKAEVEFLQTTAQGIIPIEVKAGINTRAKSLEKLCDKYQVCFAVILSANNIAYDKTKNIYYYPLYLASLQPWLTNLNA